MSEQDMPDDVAVIGKDSAKGLASIRPITSIDFTPMGTGW